MKYPREKHWTHPGGRGHPKPSLGLSSETPWVPSFVPPPSPVTLDKGLVSEVHRWRTERQAGSGSLCVQASFSAVPQFPHGTSWSYRECRGDHFPPSLAGEEPTGSCSSSAKWQSCDWYVGVCSASGAFVLGSRHLITGCGYLLRCCDVDLGSGLSLTVCGLATVTP